MVWCKRRTRSKEDIIDIVKSVPMDSLTLFKRQSGYYGTHAALHAPYWYQNGAKIQLLSASQP